MATRIDSRTTEMKSLSRPQPLSPPPLALPDLNGAAVLGKGPRLAALRPHQPLAQHGRPVPHGHGRATATEEGKPGKPSPAP